jgi:hypothetical protein
MLSPSPETAAYQPISNFFIRAGAKLHLLDLDLLLLLLLRRAFLLCSKNCRNHHANRWIFRAISRDRGRHRMPVSWLSKHHQPVGPKRRTRAR